MIVPQTLEKLNHRLAQYYLDKLRAAEAAYQRGHEHSDDALALFDCEWPHIQQWQAWAATHAQDNDEILYMCKAYSLAGGELLNFRQHPQERREWLEAGLAAACQLGDLHAEMVHLYLLAKVHHSLSPSAVAQDYARKALALAQELNHPLYISKSLIVLGNILYSHAEYAEAESVIEQAVVLSRELDARQEIGVALNVLGTIAFAQSDYGRACDYLLQAMSIYEAHGLPHQVCMVLDDLGNLTLQMGDEDAAILYAERCVTLSCLIGDQRHLASALGVLGNVAKARGNFAEASLYFQQSRDISRLLGRPSSEILAWMRSGSLFLQMGDLPAALACFESALLLPNASSFRAYSAIALMAMTQAFRRLGEPQHAYRKLCEGLEIAISIKSIRIQTWYLLEAAWLWHERGHQEQAAQWIGLLQVHVEQFDKEQQGALEELTQKLKVQLGEAPFMAAVAYGQRLDLDPVMQAILHHLSELFSQESTYP